MRLLRHEAAQRALALLLPLIFAFSSLTCVAGEMNGGWADPFRSAVQQAEAGKTDSALATLDSAAQTAAATAWQLDLRGCIYLYQGKTDEAMQTFEAAHAADAKIFAPRLHMADVLFRQGKWEEARTTYSDLTRDTNILIYFERLRYGVLVSSLAAKDESAAAVALQRIPFPTESPAYYYSQAAWSFSHGDKRGGEKWIDTADKVFKARQTAWFAQKLHDLGWIKANPPFIAEVPE
ncbi:MAG: tetratricopeptide repeat protein [Verrucomicrobiota bacterium]|nr:tetratricopeptide repeat protein [Verrucomicrobiota bacterium]